MENAINKSFSHKPVLFSKLSRKVKQDLGATDVEDLVGRYDASPWLDGEQVALIVHPNPAFSQMLDARGRVIDAYPRIEKAARIALSYYMRHAEPMVLFGTLRPGRQDMQVVLDDMILLEEFGEGVSERPYTNRRQALELWFRAHAPSAYVCLNPIYTAGTYGSAQGLADTLGGPGIILRSVSGPWVAGNGTGGQVIAVPRTVDAE